MSVFLSPGFFFFSCEFPHWCCLVFIPCQKWKGDADREHKKGARTISNRSAPWVRAHVFLQGEPHALGVGNQSKHSCCCTDLFVCVCVCVCAHIHMYVVCIRMCRCVHLVLSKTKGRRMERTCVGVWEDLNEHNLDNSGEQRGTGSFVLDREALLHSAHTYFSFWDSAWKERFSSVIISALKCLICFTFWGPQSHLW